jgi:hypothetical protein
MWAGVGASTLGPRRCYDSFLAAALGMSIVAPVLFSLLCVLSGPPAVGAGNFEGQPCDDHDPCTMEDRFADGMCRGTPRTCDDGLPCTEDFCDRVSGRCQAGLRIDACLIDGACFAEGDSSPIDPCLVCRPARSPRHWTETTACDDGDPCTHDDRCTEGRCAGTRYECSGGGECTRSRCDGLGRCTDELLPGYCRIAGLCFRRGERNPADSCRRCEPAVSTSGWTVSQGTACAGGTCSDGACLATIVIEVEGKGTGRVLGPGFTCTGVCVQDFVPERAVDLTVVPDNGSVFRGWKGACSGLAPCKLTAYGQMRVSAVFELDETPPS